MEKVAQKLQDEISTLNAQLLSTLDESDFFALVSRFLKGKLEIEQIEILRSFQDESSQVIASSEVQIKKPKTLTKDQTIASQVIKSKRPYFSNNIKRDPFYALIKLDENILSELVVPVCSQGIVLATIHLRSSEEAKFNQDSANKVIEILNLLDAPLKNMKMYLAAKQLNKSLQNKIEEKEKELLEKSKSNNASKNNIIQEVEIVGNSPEIRELLNVVDKIAPTSSNILILGESGTGKELLTKRAHCRSKRSKNPYVIVNCGAIQENLLESEFFGHEKGSFTGAIQTKLGLVEKAHTGTLFLDEVAELTPAMQTKLLRFLEQGEAYRVGGMAPYKVDVRVLAATNKDLKTEVEEGRFREDLFYRLNTITLHVPALRERRSDIAVLANLYLNENKTIEEQKTLTPSAIAALETYHWPGNIRELKNVMERVYILNEGKFIEDQHLKECVEDNDVQVQQLEEEFVEMTLSDLEKKHICRTLDHLDGNKTKTAKMLGITVKTLYNKLHSYGMINTQNSAAVQ